MRVEIRYDPADEIDPAAAHILAAEIQASNQFDTEFDELELIADPT